jgi:membrane associated rhomboid family serine protease
MNYDNQYRPGGFGFLPMVTKNIIIINVIMFILTLVLPSQIDLFDLFGLHYHLAPAFKPHQFVTYIFMHGGFAHLFFNMFAVYIFGQVLEQVWGPKRYLIFYIVTGLGAAVTQYILMHFQIADQLQALNAEFDGATGAAAKSFWLEEKYNFIAGLDRYVIVGASGSLFGLLGGFGMLFPNRYLYIYFLFPIKAKWFVVLYGAIELFFGLQNNPQDNVAHFAHLGGLFVGIILVLLWRKDKAHFY